MDIPRRSRLEKMSTGELAIRTAILTVEEMGCDERLTRAIILLGQAKDSVADFIDGVDPSPRTEGGKL